VDLPEDFRIEFQYFACIHHSLITDFYLQLYPNAFP